MKKIASALFFMGIVIFSSCIKKPTEIPVENIPPDTHIFVEGTVDTVPAKQVIHWWGNDPDGYVVGYYYNWDDSPDTIFTTLKVDTFTLQASDTINFHTLKVWALDNENAWDPTPAVLTIPVKNSPPTVEFVRNTLPPDTTLPVATFYFEGHDIDGDQSVGGFYWRLDFEDDTVIHFIERDTGYVTIRNIPEGERTITVWAVDESHALSDSITHTWYVIPVVGDILFLDDNTSSQADNFYRQIMDNNFFGQYTYYRIEYGLPYSPFDVNAIINELGFNYIIWYTGDDYEHFSYAQKYIETYLSNHKKLFLISPACLNSFYNPENPSPFMSQFLGVDTVTAWDKFILKGYNILPQASGYDTLEVQLSLISKFDGFEVTPDATPLYRLPDFTAWQGNPVCALKKPDQNPDLVFFSIQFHALDGRGNAESIFLHILRDELGYTK